MVFSMVFIDSRQIEKIPNVLGMGLLYHAHFLLEYLSPTLPLPSYNSNTHSPFLSGQHYFKPLINFGVLTHNPQLTLYRSSLLGQWGLKILDAHLKKNHLPFPKTIIHLGYDPHLTGLIGPTPLISKKTEEEIKLQQKFNYKFYNFYLDGKNPYHHRQLGHDNIVNFYNVLDLIASCKTNPSLSPILFHCTAGKHRTGMVALALRYLEHIRWSEGKPKLIYSLRNHRHFSLNWAQWEYYLHNQLFFCEENLKFADQFLNHDPHFADFSQKFKPLFSFPSGES
jgi:hypothetical protein